MPIEREVVIVSDYPSLDLAAKVYDILLSKKDPPIEGLSKFNKNGLYLDRFANGEVDDNTVQNVRNREVFVIKSSYSPQKRMGSKMDMRYFSYDPNTSMTELQLINDALVRASASNITNILPHMPYQRQDRRSIRYSETEKKWLKTRSPISARLMAENIQNSGARHVITIDPHFKQIEGFYRIPIDCLSSMVLFAEYIENENPNLENICIIAPDVGGAENADILAEMINVPMGFIRKTRGNPGVISKSSDVIIDVDITNKHAYILDDIVDGGGTLINAVNTLRKNVPKVTACISHSILTGNARKKLQEAEVNLVTLNTIPILNPEENIKIIDVAPLIAEAIYCSCTDKELSSMFYDYKQYKQKKAAGLI